DQLRHLGQDRPRRRGARGLELADEFLQPAHVHLGAEVYFPRYPGVFVGFAVAHNLVLTRLVAGNALLPTTPSYRDGKGWGDGLKRPPPFLQHEALLRREALDKFVYSPPHLRRPLAHGRDIFVDRSLPVRLVEAVEHEQPLGLEVNRLGPDPGL